MAATAQPLRIGIIGGSGLYNMTGLSNIKRVKLSTPFGEPSDEYLIGQLPHLQAELVFLPRHGRGHRVNPSEVNYRANIFGMKMLGVTWIISVSAVGSLQEEVVPGHIVLIDQFIDRTKGRSATFFEEGVVGHVGFSEPVCKALHRYLLESCKEANITYHDSGVYVNMEGPAFSTVAESKLYRSWGAKVVGMTALTEAKLAREAEISWGLIAMATDYDCWREGHDAVTVETVVQTLNSNVTKAQDVIRLCVAKIAKHEGPAPCSNALQGAIMTAPALLPPRKLLELQPIIGKYYPQPNAEIPAHGFALFLVASALIVYAARHFSSSS